MVPIRDIFEEFVGYCQANYQVGENVTIDEMLEAFRGRCKFRQYIPSKPARYGIKVYALVDSSEFYTFNLEIYAGKQPKGPFQTDNKAVSVVKRLAEPILNTGRNITMDNYFTSVPLALDLLEKRTTLVGTLRKNKREIPPLLLEMGQRQVRSSMFAFLRRGIILSQEKKEHFITVNNAF